MTTSRPWPTRTPRSATGLGRRRRDDRGRRSLATRSPTSRSSAPGSRGLWTAIALTDTDPSLRVVVLEAGVRRLRGERPQRRVLHGVADPRPRQRDPPFPRRARGSRARGRRQPGRRSSRSPGTTGSTAISRRPATLTVADQPHQVDEFRAWVDEAAAWGEPVTFLDREAVQAEVHSPIWQARPARLGRPRRPARSGQARARARARLRGARRHDPRATRSPLGHAPRSGRSAVDVRRRDRRRRPRRRRDLGVLGLAAPTLDAVRAGLRLRPRVRAAG